MIYYIHKELPTGVKTKFPERGGRIEVKYQLKNKQYEKSIEEGKYSES